MAADSSRHGWVHIVYHALPPTKLQLHTIDLVRTCRISSFCTVAWQLARFQLTRRIARSLGDSWASCVCQYQSSDWLWRPPPKWPIYCVEWGVKLYSNQQHLLTLYCKGLKCYTSILTLARCWRFCVNFRARFWRDAATLSCTDVIYTTAVKATFVKVPLSDM